MKTLLDVWDQAVLLGDLGFVVLCNANDLVVLCLVNNAAIWRQEEALWLLFDGSSGCSLCPDHHVAVVHVVLEAPENGERHQWNNGLRIVLLKRCERQSHVQSGQEVREVLESLLSNRLLHSHLSLPRLHRHFNLHVLLVGQHLLLGRVHRVRYTHFKSLILTIEQLFSFYGYPMSRKSMNH